MRSVIFVVGVKVKERYSNSSAKKFKAGKGASAIVFQPLQ